MARRRLTIKRIDPWSVLKFGALASVVLYLIFLVVSGVVWFVIDRLQLVDQACEIALDVGFTSCEVDAMSLFQVVALLGAMWVIVQTAVLVFLSFLHNLIADLTGGLVIGIIDDTPAASPGGGVPGRGASTGRSDRPMETRSVPPSERDAQAAPSRAGAARPRPRPGGSSEPLFGDDG